MRLPSVLAAVLCLFCHAAFAQTPANMTELQRQVADTERAFADSMAKRDFAAFSSFLASEAIFFNGPKVLRGKDEVAAGWKGYFAKPAAPFSWTPETVVVLDSGTLAHSSGPVLNPAGKKVAMFNSVWRLESPGVWRIVFDKGEEVCDCAKP